VDALKAEASNKPANGWKSTNSFEILENFSIINGFLPDKMHDFLKGTKILTIVAQTLKIDYPKSLFKMAPILLLKVIVCFIIVD
jgi:tetrahydromethanopterin S-methyltransferase subunit B